MSDPLSNPTINTTNVGGQTTTQNIIGGIGSGKSNSVGTPYTTPLQTSAHTAANSLSATNSPIPTHHMINSNSSNNLSGMATPGGPGLQQQQQQQQQSTISSNNLGLLGQQSQQQQQTILSPITTQPKSISASCFEFFYIEMIDCIMKSSSDKQHAHKKLDKLGFKVGHRLVERLSLDTALFPELLDSVKFICKVFWAMVFKKTIDGLKTNHKGVFVLTDSKFQWLQHLSFDSSASNKDCSEYVQFTAGLIKGAMSNFGFKCIVTFDIQQVSTCVFTIKIES
ncbi:hypothetical protein RB653_006040 [Dictyostelium firmibasis]|uniref:Trafficking protein particle complex subunit 6B n=1 Tax=Dictyostelium firmibasis TaxID=79012 RepID=A0AAN7U262_9MYCE